MNETLFKELENPNQFLEKKCSPNQTAPGPYHIATFSVCASGDAGGEAWLPSIVRVVATSKQRWKNQHQSMGLWILVLPFKKMKIWKYVMLWVHWRFHRFGRSKSTLSPAWPVAVELPPKQRVQQAALEGKKNAASTSTLLQLLQIQNHTRVIMF